MVAVERRPFRAPAPSTFGPLGAQPMAIPSSQRTPQDYRERANACERQAESATHPATREILLYLAKRWRDLAAEDEAKEQNRS